MRFARISIACLISLPLTLPAAGYAEEAGGDPSIIVTSLRTPVEQPRVSAIVTVLDEEAIRQQQPIALTDILLRTPGISLARNGGYGTTTSLRIRGADAAQSVMVIDGK